MSEITGKVRALMKRPDLFRRFTGLEVSHFEALYAQLEPKFEAAERKRLSKRERKRAIGAGTPYKLSLADQLLMQLMYYRLYVTHAFLGFMFGIDDSNVGRCFGKIGPLLAQIFRIPERRIRVEEDEILTLFLTPPSAPRSVRAAKNPGGHATPARRSATP